MLAEILIRRTLPVALFQNIGVWEWVIILAAILLLFGGRKLPELARGLARGLRIFKDEMRGVKKDIEEAPDEKDKPDKKDDTPNDSKGS